MSCLCLSVLLTQAQTNGRVRSGNLLRWGMNGSVETLEGNLAVYYGSNDTVNYNRTVLTNSSNSNTVRNPFSTRFVSVKGLCEQNSVTLSWVAVQQSGADRFEIEESPDGRRWTSVGMLPANKSEVGEASYNFNFTKNSSNTLFRVSAVSNTGEKLYSPLVESPCSPNSYLAVTPNPVYSTTTVRVGSPIATKVKLMLVDGSGVVLQNREATLIAGTNQVPVDMSTLPAGAYTLSIQWQKGKQDVLSVIKQ